MKHYDRLMQLFHWLMALFIFMVYFLHPEDDEAAIWVVMLHVSIGSLLMSMVVLRLVWKYGLAKMPEPFPAPKRQQLLSKTVHYVLYGLMILAPVSGFLMAASNEESYRLFALMDMPKFHIPHIIHEALEEVHELGSNILFFLALFHLGYALVHQFWFKDGLLDRMTKK